MPLAARLRVLLLVLASMVTGVIDAAARSGPIAPAVAAPLILACLLAMTAGIGAASKDHRALVINTAVAATIVIAAHIGVAAVSALL
jgi:hypothetical protein